MRAEWNENLEKVSWNKRIQNENKKIQDEVRLAAKAAIAVSLIKLIQLIKLVLYQYLGKFKSLFSETCTFPREDRLVGRFVGVPI